jgi:uncharacterized protein YndB with AHSA1/START domain
MIASAVVRRTANTDPERSDVMKDTIESIVVIARPVEVVFAAVTKPVEWPSWSSTVTSVRGPAAASLEAGGEFTVVAKLLGRKFQSPAVVTEFVPNELLIYRSSSGPLPSTFTWRFEVVAEGTRVVQTVVADEELAGRFFKLAYPLVERIFIRQMAADLATLKDLLESAA